VLKARDPEPARFELAGRVTRTPRAEGLAELFDG
jgi:hypothetical protein